MRKFLLGVALLTSFAAATGARASELYGGVIPPDVFTAPPAFAPPRPYNWTGVYIGLNAGGSWSSSPWNATPWPSNPMSGDSTLSGALLGGTLGYNLQADNSSFVVGAEVDLAWTSIKGSTPAFIAQVAGFDALGNPIVTPTSGCTPSCEISNPFLATARLRFGYSFDWIMPFVTAGVAVARLQANIAGIPFGREDANNLGWTVGAGVEMVIWGPWTAKLEYLHANLNGFGCETACGQLSSFDASGNIVRGGVHINASENIIRAGLNFRIWNK
jgi:outer membrane immunogenic protein